MKPALLILFLFLNLFLTAQIKDSLSNNRRDTISTKPLKPEILSNGFIDVLNNGQVNASARLIRIFIGEPGKFSIPLSLYSGVSANNFQNNQNPIEQKSNNQLVTGFINPLSGMINVSMENVLYFNKNKILTKAGWLYHSGIRVLTGYKTGLFTDPQSGKPVNFLNSFAATGFYFQTGAWEKTNSKNMGIFWASFRYIGCYTKPGHIKEFLPNISTNGFYHGYCIGSGVEINNLVNIKILYYKYIKKPEIEYSMPIYQFTFNYSLK
jgi:hypothetical protein